MACEAWSGENAGTQPSGGALDLGRDLPEASARGARGRVGRVGTLQAAADGGAAEASMCGVKATLPGVALEAGHEAVLLMEEKRELSEFLQEEELVTQEVVEAEVEEGEEVGELAQGEDLVQAEGPENEGHAAWQEEKPEESEPAQAGRPPPSARSPLEALQALQLQLSAVRARESRAYFRLKLKIGQRRMPYLERRRNIIRCIPGFWAKVIVHHPRLSALISDLDEELLSYLTDLEVEEQGHPTYQCQLKFSFRSNPYFWNDVIIKEYRLSIAGYTASGSTPILWFRDCDCGTSGQRHDTPRLNFFNWLSDHSCPESSRVAEVISEDLWPNPLQYYPREEGTGGGT